MKSQKYGSFKVFFDGDFLMTVSCSYDDLLDLLWPIHYKDSQADIVVIQDVN